MTRASGIVVACALVMFQVATAFAGQPPAAAQPPVNVDLARATLEELMNIEITSASRKEQRADAVASAVEVITHEDIRRSGLGTLPEVFRLVAGMQVAQINSSNWAISVRGFNDLWTNKLLVLIDGRSIYSRTASGVFWSVQDLLLEDVDRIEVVRGPGASVWGANAVNGVINIITKKAADTQGTFVRFGGGTFDDAAAAVRYGGTAGHVAFRVFSQWSDHGESQTADRTPASDGWNRLTSGFRTDWTSGANAVTTEGSYVTGRWRPLWATITGPTPSLSTIPFTDATVDDGSVLARWTHTRSSGASLQVQSFVDIRARDDGNGVRQHENVFDLDVQLHTTVAGRHDVVVGGGYRDGDSTTHGSFGYSVNPATSDSGVFNAFVQDGIALGRRVELTLGTKVEHDVAAGWGVQPTARMMWTIVPQHHVWAAVSRALRTPSTNDLGLRVNFTAFTGDRGTPVVIGLVGNPSYQTERFLDAEAGYRITVGSTASVDLSVFQGRYHGLATAEPQAPQFETTPGPAHVLIAQRFENLLDADTAGAELAAHWTPTDSWRLDASYSGFHLTARPDAASLDRSAATSDGNSPAHQWQLHSSLWVGQRVQLGAGLFYVGRLGELGVPAYARADARVEVRISKPLAIIAVGQNLFDPSHAEFADGHTGLTATRIPRSASLRLEWRF